MQQPPPFPTLIDSSMLTAAKACRRKFKLEYLLHWKPTRPNIHLHAGRAFAEGLEAARRARFELGEGLLDSAARGAHALLVSYGDFECPDTSAKSLYRMLGALEYYLDVFPLDDTPPILLPSKRRAIEMSFVEPLEGTKHPETGEPILISGRADAIVSFAGGVWLQDDKTTSQLGASWGNQWELRSQFSCYPWLASRSVIPVQGVLVRGVSILKTKYDHAQVLTYRPPWRLDEWQATTVELVNTLIAEWQEHKWPPNLDEACNTWGGCPFRTVCTSEDQEPWLKMYFERRQWDPVRRTETPLEAPE